MGLYAYLQPQAAKLIKTNPSFRSRYLRSMAALNQTNFKNLPGEALGALINDYLEDIIDWERSISENYRESYTAARSFVLPMNPPRFELNYAVRRFFAAHGIMIKKSHVTDWANNSRQPPGDTGGSAVASAPRKHHRHKRKPVQTVNKKEQ
jgi:poly(A) polymerase